MSLLEGILSRGGEETGALIETAFRLGCRFDGWSDRFRFDLWEEAMRRTGIDPAAYLRERDVAERFPWEIVDSGVSRDFLLAEAARAEKGEPTPDCRTGACGDCGVCDHQTIRPLTAPADAPVGTLVSAYADRTNTGNMEMGLRLRFTKLGPARFLSHLELSSALSRAMASSGLSFVYSQGYHPHPKISFAGATSVGMESRSEFVDLRIWRPRLALALLIEKINKTLPEGVAITAVRELPPRAFTLAELVVGFTYDLLLPDDTPATEFDRFEAAISAFQAADRFVVVREAKGKTTAKEIRPFVADLSLDRGGRRIRLSAHMSPAGTVRPAEILSSVLGLAAEALHRVRIVKSATRLASIAGQIDREIFLQEPS